MKIKFLSRAARPETPGKKAPWWRSAYLLIPLAALADTFIVELFNHKAFTEGFSSMAQFLTRYPLAFAVNVLLVLMTLAPALFLRRRFFWCTLMSAAWLVVGGVNGFIVMSRMTPFTTADLTVLNTGLDTLPNYMSRGYIALLAVALVALVALLIALFFFGPKNGQPIRRRLIVGLTAMAVSGGALGGSWALAFHTNQLSTLFSNLAVAYQDYGFGYCFLQTWLNKGIQQPYGYGLPEIEHIQDEISQDQKTMTAKTDVNVIFVQLESFIDPDEIQGLTLSQDAVPTWHKLEQSFTTGYLQVPVVGAGTANTEFEVLTGMSSLYFGPGEYPYKTCLQDHAIESVAYDLSALGYATHAIHNHRATFYSRNVVYANLGFDDFTSLEYMPRVTKTPKGWARDYILTSQILSALNATKDQPDLVFTVSVQGHGSYPTQEILQNPAITVDACPDTCNQYAVEYYVNQIHEMDEFISELTYQLSKRDEKTVLVLYGDHLPSLNLSNDEMKSGTLYRTKYLIWDNFGLKKKDQNLYAYQLSAKVLSKLGIAQGLMTQFHEFCSKELDYHMDLREIQYDVLYGRDYIHNEKNPYQKTDMQMGVSKIQVTDLYQRSGAWYVRGENFSPYCKVTVDGKILETTYITPTLLRIEEDPGTENYEDLVISVVDMHKEVLSDTE